MRQEAGWERERIRATGQIWTLGRRGEDAASDHGRHALPLELLGHHAHLVSISWVLTLSSCITVWCTWCVLLLFDQPAAPAQLHSSWHIASCLFSPDKNRTKFTKKNPAKMASWSASVAERLQVCHVTAASPVWLHLKPIVTCYAPPSLPTDFLSASSPHSAQ